MEYKFGGTKKPVLGSGTDFGIYFGIRINGDPVNPKKWCQQLKNRNQISFFPVLNREMGILSNSSGIPAEWVWISRKGIELRETGSKVQQVFSRVLDKV